MEENKQNLNIDLKQEQDKKKKRKLLMCTLIRVSALALATGIVTPIVVSCKKKEKVKLVDSDKDVSIKETIVDEKGNTTITLTIPDKKEVDEDQLVLTVDGTRLNKDDYKVEGQKIIITNKDYKDKDISITVKTIDKITFTKAEGSSDDVTINTEQSSVHKGKESTIVLTLPNGKVIDETNLEVIVGGKPLQKDEYEIVDGNRIKIKDDKVTSDISVKVISKEKGPNISVELAEQSKTKTFKYGDTIKASDIVVKATYQLSGEKIIEWGTNGYQIYAGESTTGTLIDNFKDGGFKFEKVGKYKFSVKFDKITCPFVVDVQDVLDSISGSAKTTKIYQKGIAITDNDIVVEVTYLSKSKKTITWGGQNGYKIYEGEKATGTPIKNFDTDGYTFNGTGEKSLTVSYTEGDITRTKTIQFNISKKIDSVSVSLSDTTKTFKYGDTIKSSNITVKVKYDGETGETEVNWGTNGYQIYAGESATGEPISQFNTNGYVLNNLGENKFTIYYGQTATLTIDVVDAVSSLDVKLNKEDFVYGDYIKAENITVTAKYAGGTEDETLDYSTDKYTVYEGEGTTGTEITNFATGKQLNELGEKKFTVSYKQVTKTFSVDVKDEFVGISAKVNDGVVLKKGTIIKPDDITVTPTFKSPEKTPIQWGENGYKISLNKDGNKEELTNFGTDGYTFAENGKYSFEIEYSGKTCNLEEIQIGNTFEKTAMSVIIAAANEFEKSNQDVTAMKNLCNTFTDVEYIENIDQSISDPNKQIEAHLANFIGKTTTIKINERDHIIRVIGINHDTIANGELNGKKATFTFDLVTLLSDKNKGEKMTYKWNESNWNDYTQSSLKWYLSNTDEDYWTPLVMLPSDIKSAIKTVNKQVGVPEKSSDEYKLTNYNDKLFPLTYTEIGLPDSEYAVKGEGSPYKYWTDHNKDADRIKKDVAGNPFDYWLASPYKDGENDDSAWCVTKNGGFGFTLVYETIDNGSGVSFGFCI